MSALDDFLAATGDEVRGILSTLDREALQNAAALIWEAEERGGRVHITGIGKPAHVASYLASLMSSTGTPTYFLHGTEAVHGSCGQLVPGDVVICISNSGETQELKATAEAVRSNGCKIVAVTGNRRSWLYRFADAGIPAGVTREGGPLGRAPRASILVETIALQALSVLLQEKRGLTPQEYVARHPGGALGKLREDEKTG